MLNLYRVKALYVKILYICTLLGDNPLAFLRTVPHFNEMRRAIRQNPRMLQAMLQDLRQSNPQLLQVFTLGNLLEYIYHGVYINVDYKSASRGLSESDE